MSSLLTGLFESRSYLNKLKRLYVMVFSLNILALIIQINYYIQPSNIFWIYLIFDSVSF